jgi:hypothetical protein
MGKVIIGITGAVMLLLAGMLAGNAEAARLTGCCQVDGAWMCGTVCESYSQAPPPAPTSAPTSAPNCCRLFGKWLCACPQAPQ